LHWESSAMPRPLSFSIVPNCVTPCQTSSQAGEGTGADPATHASLDKTKPVSHSNPHATPLQVAFACSGGGAAQGVQDAPQVFKLELLTHCPAHLCWPASHSGGRGALQMIWPRHSADPASWLTTKRFSTTF